MWSRRAVLCGVGAMIAGASAGCLEDGTDPTGDITVRLTDAYRFDPVRVEIETATTVLWRHEGRGMHSVTAYQDSVPEQSAYFASGGATSEFRARLLYPLVGTLAPGDAYAYTFEIPGSYRYFSIPGEEAGMTGEVIVQ